LIINKKKSFISKKLSCIDKKTGDTQRRKLFGLELLILTYELC